MQLVLCARTAEQFFAVLKVACISLVAITKAFSNSCSILLNSSRLSSDFERMFVSRFLVVLVLHLGQKLASIGIS